jgi:chemotaxis protein CheX
LNSGFNAKLSEARQYTSPDEGRIMPIETTQTLPGMLAQIVRSVFGTMLGLEVLECPPPWAVNGARLTAAVHLSGDWNGVVFLECGREQAYHFTWRFLSADPAKIVEEDVRDVLGELANMLAGNLKSALTPGVVLSMPSVVEGSDYSWQMCGRKTTERAAFFSAGGIFSLTLVGVPVRV